MAIVLKKATCPLTTGLRRPVPAQLQCVAAKPLSILPPCARFFQPKPLVSSSPNSGLHGLNAFCLLFEARAALGRDRIDALLHRRRDGRRTETELLEGVTQERLATAKRLIGMFVANGLTAFEASESAVSGELATLRLQAGPKHASVS